MRKDIALSLLAAAITLPAYAQTEGGSDPATDEKVIVTATRNPLPGRDIAASVIVLQRDDFEKSGAQTVSDILRGLPGITMRRSGGAGSNTEILIRGDKGGHTMVMLDGMELADVSTIEKNFDIGDLPLHDVERIEILKGPHSVAYGGSGLSGVIHIITRRPEAGVGGSAGIEAGSYETYGAHARVAGQSGNFGYKPLFRERVQLVSRMPDHATLVNRTRLNGRTRPFAFSTEPWAFTVRICSSRVRVR